MFDSFSTLYSSSLNGVFIPQPPLFIEYILLYLFNHLNKSLLKAFLSCFSKEKRYNYITTMLIKERKKDMANFSNSTQSKEIFDQTQEHLQILKMLQMIYNQQITPLSAFGNTLSEIDFNECLGPL